MIVSVTCIIIRGAANTRYFLFPVANFPFRLQFFCSHLMNCWNLWKLGVFAILFVHLPAWK